MEKTLTKEEQDTVRRQMHEILDIVLDCNGFEDRRKDITGALPTAFLRFSGHVSKVDVDIFPDGWESNAARKTWDLRTDSVNRQCDIEAMRYYAKHALDEKKESEVLARSIAQQEENVQREKERLAELRKSLKKAEKKEKAVGAA